MRLSLGKLLAALAIVGFSSAAQAVTMELISVAGPQMGGVYTSPYTALVGDPGETVGQLAVNGVATTILCDDFLTDVSVGQFWQAQGTSIAALAGLSTPDLAFKFGTTGTAAAQQSAYLTLAYLAEQLVSVNQSTADGAAQAGQLSFAMWSVYDPAAMNSLSGVNLSSAQADLARAAAAIKTPGLNAPQDYSNVLVYTPLVNGASQEYLVVKPANVTAPGTTALLAICLIGLFVWARRRQRS